MYDLYVPFPQPTASSSSGKPSKLNKPSPNTSSTSSCWDNVTRENREKFTGLVGGLGYLGYKTVALTTTLSKAGSISPSPFKNGLPFPHLTRNKTQTEVMEGTGPGAGAVGARLDQFSRLHLILDDSSTHGLNASSTPALSTYTLISVQPTTPEAFNKACTDLTKPSPNQVGIITIQADGARLPFRGMRRSLVRTALRNGAVFEIIYSPTLSPSDTSDPLKQTQNFLQNAREAVRVIMAVSGGGGRDGVKQRGKGGGGIIFSSGPSGAERGWEGLRGAGELINLAIMLGMPANQAREAVLETPKKVLLRAHARQTYKGVLSIPRFIEPAVGSEDEQTKKRKGLETEKGDVVGDGKALEKKIKI